jgi:hypothetical protein
VKDDIVSAVVLVLLLVLACKPSRDGTASTTGASQTVLDSAKATRASTKLQAAGSRTGTILILGFSPIGKINALYGTSVGIEARELTEPDSQVRVYGLAIHVAEGGTLERQNTSYVDYDEIQPLLKGIDFIGKADKSVTHLKNFQAEYRTRGDLVISTFNSGSGQILAAIKSGEIGGATAYVPVSQLGTLRDFLVKATQVLDSIRSPTGRL